MSGDLAIPQTELIKRVFSISKDEPMRCDLGCHKAFQTNTD